MRLPLQITLFTDQAIKQGDVITLFLVPSHLRQFYLEIEQVLYEEKRSEKKILNFLTVLQLITHIELPKSGEKVFVSYTL